MARAALRAPALYGSVLTNLVIKEPADLPEGAD